jgi:predicted MPP superfamily phosphohydrolase
MKRKTFLKIGAGIFGVGLVNFLYAWQVEPFQLEFVHQNMPIKNLPTSLDGKVVMQLSDLHVGKRFDHRYLIESLEKAKKYNPDFVVYTGDYVSTYRDKVQYDLLEEVLRSLVKGSIATVAIFGNHDYGVNWKEPEVADKIATMMEGNGITVLRNQQATYEGLSIIGMDDCWGTNFNPKAALAHYQPETPTIVLCHNPDVCDLDVWGNYEGWILSGHTHGGQVKAPFLPPFILPVKNRRYAAGVVPLDNKRMLYVNRALGHLWQVRYNVRPEITLFTLQNSSNG